ncbi:MAG: pilus assembly protein PilP [Nitrosomonas sp.]|nr:pilus assembly protein PilP [Nitrosomonas sp.]
MKRANCQMVMLLFSTLLIACEGDSSYSDLEAFVSTAGEGLAGHVDPLPAVKAYEPFTYTAFEIPSPFAPRKNEQMLHVSSDLQPDLNRRKEFLESFPLESLQMVGSLEQNEIFYGVIKSPEGTLYRVTVGNYLGQDFGQIRQISESEIRLREIIQDGVNEWTERVSTLMLKN